MSQPRLRPETLAIFYLFGVIPSNRSAKYKMLRAILVFGIDMTSGIPTLTDVFTVIGSSGIWHTMGISKTSAMRRHTGSSRGCPTRFATIEIRSCGTCLRAVQILPQEFLGSV